MYAYLNLYLSIAISLSLCISPIGSISLESLNKYRNSKGTVS